MKEILQFIIDTIYPPSKDSLLVREFNENNIDTFFDTRLIEGTVCLTSFTNEHVKALVHETKFHNNKKSTRILGKLFIAHLKRLNLDESHIFIPIPLSKSRQRDRGYNQVEEVLKMALLDFDTRPNTKTLKRTINTKPQTNLHRKERLQNLTGAFSVIDSDAIFDKNIIIVDDVLTTGTTMNEAKATLSLHKPKSITSIALAH